MERYDSFSIGIAGAPSAALREDASELCLYAAATLRVQRRGALQVAQGRVWLTVEGGGDDHVLAAGERFSLAPGARVVVESWTAGQPALLNWQPSYASYARRREEGLAAAWDLLARGLCFGAAALAAAARSAEARARRNHGAIAAGESIASSGALQ